MKALYYNIITFISGMSSLLKCLIIAILFIIDMLLTISIVKSHVNASKPVFKVGQILLLLFFVAITLFVIAHV